MKKLFRIIIVSILLSILCGALVSCKSKNKDRIVLFNDVDIEVEDSADNNPANEKKRECEEKEDYNYIEPFPVPNTPETITVPDTTSGLRSPYTVENTEYHLTEVVNLYDGIVDKGFDYCTDHLINKKDGAYYVIGEVEKHFDRISVEVYDYDGYFIDNSYKNYFTVNYEYRNYTGNTDNKLGTRKDKYVLCVKFSPISNNCKCRDYIPFCNEYSVKVIYEDYDNNIQYVHWVQIGALKV